MEPKPDASTPKAEITIKALKDSVVKKALDEGRVIVAVDDTYETGIVYAFGDFKLYVALYRAVLDSKDMPSEEATAYCTFGPGKMPDLDGMVCLVWVNSKMMDLKQAMPSFAHEISHLADDILKHANVRDETGEARAYIVEREVRRITQELFKTEAPLPITVAKLKEALK